MNRLRHLLVICSLAFAASAYADSAPQTPPAPAPAAPVPPEPAPVGAIAAVDHVVATVDGWPIWISAVDELIEPVLAADPKAFRGEIEPKAIDSLIEQTLIHNRARQLHIEVENDEMDMAIKEIMTQNNLDAAGLDVALKQNGLTMAGYRIRLREQLFEGKAFRVWLKDHATPEATEDEITAALAAIKAHDPKAAAAATHDQVRDMVRGQKLQVAHDAWVAELRRNARIEKR